VTSQVSVKRGGDVVTFRPQEAKAEDAKADAVIDFARRVHDWPTLVDAVEKKIDDQEEFVRWWRENVRKTGQPKKESAQIGANTFLTQDAAEDFTGIKHQQVSRWLKRLADKEKYRALLYGAAYRKAFGDASQLNQQSLSNEHYTPPQYIEAARAVLGGIDLDPASCAEANKVVGATSFLDDGLGTVWQGRVWLNPPYGRMAGDFIVKLAAEYGAGNVSAAIALVNAHCTDTSWFQPLWNGVLCFTNHRINFYGDDERSGSTHGSVFIYFGPNRNDFVRHFKQFGAVVERVNSDNS
jgi:hypothetical protein